ncbi:hypothetical protein Pvag_2267 [Pantoea vagans C9-1]|nr:hypothetical protein Pvag_2267 [Pantoea vagans C9-1]
MAIRMCRKVKAGSLRVFQAIKNPLEAGFLGIRV